MLQQVDRFLGAALGMHLRSNGIHGNGEDYLLSIGRGDHDLRLQCSRWYLRAERDL